MTTVTSTWIEVGKELPDADTDVLIACADGCVYQGFLDGNIWRDATGMPCPIIAWAPMPEYTP